MVLEHAMESSQRMTLMKVQIITITRAAPWSVGSSHQRSLRFVRSSPTTGNRLTISLIDSPVVSLRGWVFEVGHPTLKRGWTNRHPVSRCGPRPRPSEPTGGSHSIHR